MSKAMEAFRTISEVADDLGVPKHVLRFWEVKFPQIKPMKRGGGRRYYRPEDVVLLRGIRNLLHAEGYTIKGVQKILREQGVDEVKGFSLAAARQPGRGEDSAEGGLREPSIGHSGRIRALPNNRKTGKSDEVGRSQPEVAEIIAASIRELEACRKSLSTGAAIASLAGADPRTRRTQKG